MATFSNNLDPSPEELLESMVTSLDETQEEGIDQMVEFNGHKTLNEENTLEVMGEEEISKENSSAADGTEEADGALEFIEQLIASVTEDIPESTIEKDTKYFSPLQESTTNLGKEVVAEKMFAVPTDMPKEILNDIAMQDKCGNKSAQSEGKGIIEPMMDMNMAALTALVDELKITVAHKDHIIDLSQRENSLMLREQEALKKEKEIAIKEKDNIVLKFATKEKLLLHKQKEKEALELKLAEFPALVSTHIAESKKLTEEKLELRREMEKKSAEIRQKQQELEHYKAKNLLLESKILSLENAARNSKMEQKTVWENKVEEVQILLQKTKVETDAQIILLKHELSCKAQLISQLNNDLQKSRESHAQQEQRMKDLSNVNNELEQRYVSALGERTMARADSEEGKATIMELQAKLNKLEDENNSLQATKAIYEATKIELNDIRQQNADNLEDIHALRNKEKELLDLNKKMAEGIANLQNELTLLRAEASGIGVKDDLMYKQNCKLLEENAKLKEALNFERVVREDNQEAMAKSISSQIKMYEVLQKKYEDAVNEAEAHKIKYTSQIKEQKLEIVTMKRALRRERVKAEESPNRDEANASPPAERLD